MHIDCECSCYSDKQKHCFICDYYKKFHHFNSVWKEVNEKLKEKCSDETVLDSAKQLYELIGKIVTETHESTRHKRDKNEVKGGDRRLVSDKIEELLKNFLGKDAKRNYKINDYKKSIDVFLESKKIAIEVKTWLEFNSLGAAILESMVSDHEKFFVFSLSTKKEGYEKLRNLAINITITGKQKLIDGLVVLDPKIPNFETDLINFLTSTKNEAKQ